jgi:hypothetical protein
MRNNGKLWLLFGAFLNIGIAMLHVVMLILGAPAYVYFGRTTFAELAAQGSPLPAILTLILAIIFLGCAGYALAGLGLLARPPLLREGLLLIAFIYLLRGAKVIIDVGWILLGSGLPFRQVVFSLVALVVGVVYLLGIIGEWNYLAPGRARMAR